MREPLAKAGCTLELRVEEGPITGRWDATRLAQVLLNLRSNALKFGAGEPITVAAGVERGTAWLCVRDLGIGIARTGCPTSSSASSGPCPSAPTADWGRASARGARGTPPGGHLDWRLAEAP